MQTEPIGTCDMGTIGQRPQHATYRSVQLVMLLSNWAANDQMHPDMNSLQLATVIC